MLDWKRYQGRREVIAHPEGFSEKRFGVAALRDAASKAQILYRGWPFIYFDSSDTKVLGDGLLTEVDLARVRGHDYFEAWRLLSSGLFYHRALMDEDTYPPIASQGKVLGFEMTIYHVSEAIGSLWHLYTALGVADTERVTMVFCYLGMKDRDLRVTSPRRAGFSGRQTCHSPSVKCERSLPLGEWRASEVDLATEVSVSVFEQCQWIQPDVAPIRELASGLLARAK